MTNQFQFDLEQRLQTTQARFQFLKNQAISDLDQPPWVTESLNEIAAFLEELQELAQTMMLTSHDSHNHQLAEQAIQHQSAQEALLREITQRIRQTLDLQTIFTTACEEIRQVMQTDRVGIFKFHPETHYDDGEFVAESVVDQFSSVLAVRVHDHCFGEDYSALYAQGRFQVVDDIDHAGLKPCHRDVLALVEVKANLVMPLLCGEQLWGLLCLHQCAAPRQWQQAEIDLAYQLATQLAIAIQQANLYDQVQTELAVRQQAEKALALQLQRQQTLGTIIQHIRESLNLNEILATVTHQVKEVLDCDRVIVFRLFADGRSQIVDEAVSPEFPVLKERHWDDENWSQDILDYYWQGQPRIVPDVMDDNWTDCLVDYSIAGQIQSKIVAPILQEIPSHENGRWVSPEQSSRLWGILVAHACREKRVWLESEAQLLQQIAIQLAIAIQQASLFEQLQQELKERQQAQLQLTERNQQLAISNEELARATRLKDEFLANMSHELRTPLNAILGMTEGLHDQILGSVNTQQIKALETIASSSSHLLDLINDILDVAKIESGQFELDCAPTAVAPLCQSSLAFIKQQAVKKRIQLEIKLPPDLPDVIVDERRIRQVLINLLNNAVKFTPPGGRIILEVSRQTDRVSQQTQHLGLGGLVMGSPLSPYPANPESEMVEISDSLRLTVSDTGIGIAPEHIDKLFQPFIQIDSALNRKYEGTGLGLALVKRIVELHGGSVSLTSQVKHGSCFTVDLPYVQPKTPSPAKPKTAFPLKAQLNPESLLSERSISPLILLVEDNEANISTISSYLTARGYRLVLARDGHEAIAQNQIEQPDLILMDIQMPGMDGLEAIHQIRSNPNCGYVPIIALTALAMVGDRDRCLEAGANDYLSKPVKLKELVHAIRRLLK